MTRMLTLYILCSFVFCSTARSRFLPNVLESKIRSMIQSTSNQIDIKLWMEYLEKGLGTVKDSYINSLLEFHKRNFGNNPLKDVSLNCDNIVQDILDELQVGIFGQICGSSKTAKKKKKVDPPMCLLRKIDRRKY